MTKIVSSKADFESAKAEADEIGMRLAFVIAKAPGVWEVTFRRVETFTDWSAS